MTFAELAAGWGKFRIYWFYIAKLKFCSFPMSWQEDVIIWCVAQEADEGDSDCWCPRGNVQATENTKLSQYWGKKHTRLWHYEGRTKCFLVSRPRKLHSCFWYWKMMVMGHHRKSKILFIFLPSYSWSRSKSTVPSDDSNKQLDDDFWIEPQID